MRPQLFTGARLAMRTSLTLPRQELRSSHLAICPAHLLSRSVSAHPSTRSRVAVVRLSRLLTSRAMQTSWPIPGSVWRFLRGRESHGQNALTLMILGIRILRKISRVVGHLRRLPATPGLVPAGLTFRVEVLKRGLTYALIGYVHGSAHGQNFNRTGGLVRSDITKQKSPLALAASSTDTSATSHLHVSQKQGLLACAV